jgi:hypothetical protein
MREEKRKDQSPNKRQTSKVHNAQWGALRGDFFLIGLQLSFKFFGFQHF